MWDWKHTYGRVRPTFEDPPSFTHRISRDSGVPDRYTDYMSSRVFYKRIDLIHV